MNLRTFLLATLVLPASLLQAQTNVSSAYFHSTRQGKLHTYIGNLLNIQNKTDIKAKTTATKERLKSSVSVLANSNILDTALYQYSIERGSQYDLNYMRYNDLYSIDPSPQSYPYLPGRIDVQSDSMTRWVNKSGTLETDKTTSTTYTAGNAVSAYKENTYYQGNYDWSDDDHHVYANNKLQEIRTLSNFNGGAMDSLDKTVLQYNSQDQLTQLKVYTYDNNQWNLIANVDYTYNSNGKLVNLKTTLLFNGNWIDQSELVHTYYPDNTLQTVTVYENDGIALAPSIKDSFAYSAGVDYFSSLYEYLYDPSMQQWMPANKIAKHINQQLLPDTVTYYHYDDQAQSWKEATKLELSYTSFGNPELISVYEDALGNGNLSYIGKYHYYYEQYNVTDVEPIPAEMNVRIFPNPATDNITVQFTGTTDNHTIILSDISGKVLYKEQTREPRLILSLKDLAPGFYLLNVQTKSGQQTFKVAKQ